MIWFRGKNKLKYIIIKELYNETIKANFNNLFTTCEDLQTQINHLKNTRIETGNKIIIDLINAFKERIEALEK
jgi:hypothetical protein